MDEPKDLKEEQQNQLPSIGALFSQTIAAYKRRWKVLLTIMFFPSIASLIQSLWTFLTNLNNHALLHTLFNGFGPLVGLLTVLLSIALPVFNFILLFWGEVALILVMNDQSLTAAQVGGVYKVAWKKVARYWWVTVLTVLCVLSGAILFVIPAFVFTVWFLFAGYIAVVEDRKPVAAFVRSRGYAQGYGWSIFGRYLAILLPGMVVSYAISFISRFAVLGEMHVVSPLYMFFVSPFIFLYTFSLYSNIRQVHPIAEDYDNKTTKRILYTFAILAIPLFILLISVFVFLQNSKPIQIASTSMSPRFVKGQVYAMRKSLGSLKRNDVIVFTSPDKEKLAVRRIIGIPGDSILIQSGRIYVNGVPVDESAYLFPNMQTTGGTFVRDGQSVLVPNERYFVLADNRSNASDSRNWGFIPFRAIQGTLTVCLRNCSIQSLTPTATPYPSDATPLPTFTCAGGVGCGK